MDDHDSKRREPFQSRAKSSHYGRPGVGTKGDSAKPRTVSESHGQPSRKGSISPPPLKRQRTTYDNFSSETRDSRSTNRQAHLPTSSAALRHSFNGHTQTASAAPSQRKPNTFPVSKSFPAPPAPHRQDNRDTHQNSQSRLAPRPRRPSKPVTLGKPVCRICEKSSATSFNPIVSCSECSRSYHDSCRKPSLAPGIDPQHWRCSLCLSDGGMRKNLSMSSALAPASHSVVRDIFKPRYAQPALDDTSSSRPLKKTSATHVKPEPTPLTTNTATTDELVQPKKAPSPPQPPAPKPLNCTEIPNTPSQGSSQIESSMPDNPFRHLRNDHVSQQSHHMQDDENALPLDAPVHATIPSLPLTRRSSCQRQGVLARSAENGVQCSSCRINKRFADTGRLEIPETPNGDTSDKTSLLPISSGSSIACISATPVDDSVSNMVSSAHDLARSRAKPELATFGASPLSWFDPEQVKSLSEVEKVRDDESCCISTADIQATDNTATSYETSLGQSMPIEMGRVANINEQKTALNVEQVLQGETVRDNDSLPQVDMQCENCTPPTDISNHDEPSRTPEPDSTHSTSTSNLVMLENSEPQKPAAALVRSLESSLDIVPQQTYAELTTGRVVPILSVEEQAPSVLESRGTPEEISVPIDPNVSLSPTRASTGSPAPDESLSHRELVRIALVCAKGTGLTALQVIDWLASKFPHLQKGQGGWEKTTRAVLSRLPEIRGVRSWHQPVLYNFASAALKAENEERYRSYLPTIPVSGPQGSNTKARKSVRRQHETDAVIQEEHHHKPPTPIKSCATKAIKSAPSRRNVTTHQSVPLPLVLEGTHSHGPVSAPVTEPVEIDTSAANPDGEQGPSTPSVSGPRIQDADADKARVISDDDTMSNPFERTVTSRPNMTLSGGLETKRETSLRSVYPRTVAPTIETMTPEEKAAKIAEIKLRPKRKQFFGSVDRLAHVRRYRRQDIHDQSDGAWKPNSMTERTMGEQDSVAPNEHGENRSLLQIFNLPSNAIPMNDGRELAFRDGTLINGRLPRPRQVYRVGKVCGGELTIR